MKPAEIRLIGKVTKHLSEVSGFITIHHTCSYPAWVMHSRPFGPYRYFLNDPSFTLQLSSRMRFFLGYSRNKRPKKETPNKMFPTN